jgi:hypothetical protein
MKIWMLCIDQATVGSSSCDVIRRLQDEDGNVTFKFQIIRDPLKTKHWPLYLKTQSVPRSKHFSSR